MQKPAKSFNALLEVSKDGLANIKTLVIFQGKIDLRYPIKSSKSISNMLSFPKDKVMVNIHKYGNTTSGTIPLCLWEYEDRLKKGQNIVLTAFGGGFTWGATLLKWGYDGNG